jgi:hypothetical protein
MITQILKRSSLPGNWTAWVADSQDRLVSAIDGPGLEGRFSADFAHAATRLLRFKSGSERKRYAWRRNSSHHRKS